MKEKGKIKCGLEMRDKKNRGIQILTGMSAVNYLS